MTSDTDPQKQPHRPLTGLSRTSHGGNEAELRIKNGRTYTLHQEEWSVRSDYYLEATIAHLEELVAGVEIPAGPVRNILEIGIARGAISIGLALLRPEAQIVGIDIQEEARELVRKNAERNHVAHQIDVRIGDMYAPIAESETFDMVIAELPFIPVRAEDQKKYIADGHASEILNISGGPDGRRFIDRLIDESPSRLRPGGSLLFAQPSFIGIDRTLQRLHATGLSGRILLTKPWRLADTIFTRANRDYIEQVTGYVFPENEPGDPYFFITIVQGIKPE